MYCIGDDKVDYWLINNKDDIMSYAETRAKRA